MIAREDFEWDGVSWVATYDVPEWSVESVQLVLFPETSSLTSLDKRALEIAAAYERGASSQATAALNTILEAYPEIYSEYVDAIDPDFVEQDLPKVMSKEELLAIVKLTNVHLQPVVAGGLPYVGYEAECSWDPEHGVGVLMHGERCVQWGGADTAILQWIAERDATKFSGIDDDKAQG